MKCLFLYLLLLPLFAIGQIQIFNMDLFDTSKQQLFLHVRNDLVVKSSKKIDEMWLGSSKQFSSPVSNIFEVYPNKFGADTIKLYSKGRLVHTAVFKVDIVPNEVVRIGRSVDTIMSVQQIQLNPFLSILFPETNYKGKLYVCGFLMTVENFNEGFTAVERGNLNQFTPRQLNLIKLLLPGDKLHFTEIRGLSSDGRVVAMPPFIVIIK